MSRICRRVQRILSEQGPAALRSHAAAQRHLETCDECFTVLESISQLDAALAAMPELDAPDALVEQLLDRAELRSPEAAPTAPPLWRLWAGRLGGGFEQLFGPGQLRLKAAVALALIVALSPWAYLRLQRAGLPMSMAEGLIDSDSENKKRYVLDSVKFKPPERQAPQSPPPEDKPLSEEETEKLEAIDYLSAEVPGPKKASMELGTTLPAAGERSDVVRKLDSFSRSVGQRNEPLPRAKRVPIPDPTPDLSEPVIEGQERSTGAFFGEYRPVDPAVGGQYSGGQVGDRRQARDKNLAGKDAATERDSSSEIEATLGEEIMVTAEMPKVSSSRTAASSGTAEPDATPDDVWVGNESNLTFRGGSPRIESDAAAPFDDDDEARKQVRERLRGRLRDLPRGLQDAAEAEKELDKRSEIAAAQDDMIFSIDGVVSFENEPPSGTGEGGAYETDTSDNRDSFNKVQIGKSSLDEAAKRQAVLGWLDDRDRLEGLSFQPAEGYWSNTYVPGDPVLRTLQARLAGRDRAPFEALTEATPLLHDAAQQTTQPFDPPSGAALAVYLSADRRAVAGESRLLVQVGLVATERYGGRRPAMNVGVVLDLRRPVAPETAASLRAFLMALGEARDLGDRFRLIVAGPQGGEVLGPDDFKHGPLTVAMQRLFAAEGILPEGDVPGPQLSGTAGRRPGQPRRRPDGAARIERRHPAHVAVPRCGRGSPRRASPPRRYRRGSPERRRRRRCGGLGRA